MIMGRTIEQMWQSVWEMLRHAGVADNQQVPLRAAFYSGAAAIMESSLVMASQGATTEEVSQCYSGWYKEILEERRLVIEGYAMRASGLKPGEQN